MSITMQHVRNKLAPDEPNYVEAARMGAEALPHLLMLVRDGDVMFASKAAYLAGMIDAEGSAEVLIAAFDRPEPEVCIAAAATVKHLRRDAAAPVLRKLEQLPDPGIYKLLKVSRRIVRRPPLRPVP